MSLSARIAMAPSRRLARLATLVPAGGVVVVSATLAARRPEVSLALAVAAAAIVAGLLALHVGGGRRAGRFDVLVSDDPQIEIVAATPALDGSWRLGEGTLAWPGFSMLAIERNAAAGTTIRRFVPAFDAELDRDDRRALARLLRWSIGGGASAHARSSDDGRR